MERDLFVISLCRSTVRDRYSEILTNIVSDFSEESKHVYLKKKKTDDVSRKKDVLNKKGQNEAIRINKEK